MKKLFYGLFFCLVILSGCKDDKISDNEENLTKISLDTTKALGVNDIRVTMNKYGDLYTDWRYSTSDGGFISLAGLWIAAEQDGEIRGNLATQAANHYRSSNFTSEYKNKQYGLYYLDGSISYSSTNWPVEFGAPVSTDGKPKVYGDAMCWQVLFSDSTVVDNIFKKPIRGLRICEAMYGYRRSDLRYVFFIRYSITNTTTRNWNNVYVGFYSDTDLYGGENKTAYDSTNSITYTYGDGYNYVTGFSFLQTPQNGITSSSRIMRKNDYYDPDFGEYTFTTPGQIMTTLQGYSNSGLPMINPVTGKVTKFAFTGDPIFRTGWLDKTIDTRNIISSGPFTLNAGETTTVSVVWVTTNGINLGDSITQLKDKINYVRQNSSLWKY